MILIWWALFGLTVNGFLVLCAFVGILWIHNKTNIFYPHDRDKK